MSDTDHQQPKRSALNAFKRQKLPSWQPILTPIPVIITFLTLGVILVPLGVAFYYAADSVLQYSTRYDNKCDLTPNTHCNVTIDVEEDMDQPVYLYYRLTNYYQNHRRYARSKNDAQLRGEAIHSYKDLDSCEPIKSKGDSHNEKNFYYPCGLIAWSLFNDTFQLLDPQGGFVDLSKHGVAWDTDKNNLYETPPKNTDGIFLVDDFQDEDFIVWMRTAGLPDFVKLYRIIRTDIKKGKYTIMINNTYPTDDFDGEKHVVLSTVSWMGGKNFFYAYAYFIVGGLCMLCGLAFAASHLVNPRKLGDRKHLHWSN